MIMSRIYTFQEIIDITKKVIGEFNKVEQKPWTLEATMIELSKQVGDLAKHIMVFEKYYLKKREEEPNYKTKKEDIGDELADIIYCLIRIAEHYGINLEEACLKARRNELEYFGKKPSF